MTISTRHNPRRNHNNEGDTPSPTLIIPYTPSDVGLGRPLALFWDCPFIFINSVHVTGQKVETGQTYDLSCDIKNVGDATTFAYVSFYWHEASPTPSAPTLIGMTQGVLLPPDSTAYSSGPVSWTVEAPPSGPPLSDPQNHTCLLAVVWSADHLPTGNFNVAIDPQYGQMNLFVSPAVTGKPISFLFHAANSHDEPIHALVEAHPIAGTNLRQLAGRLRATAQSLGPESIQLRADGGSAPQTQGSQIELDLRPREERRLELVFESPRNLDALSFVGVEIVQTQVVRDKRQIVGGIGVVVFGAGD
jgi:hypothetical protein